MNNIKDFSGFVNENIFDDQHPEHHEHIAKMGHIEPEMHTGVEDDSVEYEHYMFFSNLKTIKRLVDILLEMDPQKVNDTLSNGHAWADDHIATSKDDLEEVADFFMGEMETTKTDIIHEEPNF